MTADDTLSQSDDDAARMVALTLEDIESQVLTNGDLDTTASWLERYPYTHTAIRAIATVLRDRWEAPATASILESILPELAQHESEVC